MNKVILGKFYTLMLEGENLATASSLKEMLEELVTFRVDRLLEEFKYDHAPFTSVGNYQGYVAWFDGCPWKDATLGIEVIVEAKAYLFRFLDKSDRDGAKGGEWARLALEGMGCFNDYTRSEGCFLKTFTFHQETELVTHIRVFKSRLAEFLEANS